MLLRRVVIVTHRWTGLTLGLLAVVMAVTGAGLALEPIFERGDAAPTACATPVPLDRQLAAARAADPTDGARLIRLDLAADGPTVLRFSDSKVVSVDPCSGTAIAVQDRFGGVFGRLEQLHRLAYGPDGAPNKLIKGSAALALVFLSLGGGFYLWWPRRRFGWRRAFMVDRQLIGRAFALNLHWAAGLSTGLIILAVALTGVVIAFDWAQDALYPLTLSTPHKAKFVVPPEPASVPLETAWQTLQRYVPAPESALLRLPQKPGAPLLIDAVAPGAPHGMARSTLLLDPATGQVLDFQPYEGLSRGRKLFYWMLAIHTGRAGGWPVDVLLFLGMLGVPVMGYTGIESWLRRRRRIAAAAPGRACTREAA
jgi:uncharacterized iron-regulated membrane protein